MNLNGRNNPNKIIEKTFSGDILVNKNKYNNTMNINKDNNSNKLHGQENKSKDLGSTAVGSGTNVISSSPKNKEKLIKISEFRIEPSNQNNKISLNNSKDIINRLKNQSSSLKSSIINKNNINKNENPIISCFQGNEKENSSLNKLKQSELSHINLVKGVNILGKHDTFEIEKKKHGNGYQNKFNKNSYFISNNNNKNIVNKNIISKDMDMLMKIKNLKTFHPGKNSNKNSITIKVNKEKNDDLKNKNTENNNQIKREEKNKSKSKNKNMNKSIEINKKKENSVNEISTKEIKENENIKEKKVEEEKKIEKIEQNYVKKEKNEIKEKENYTKMEKNIQILTKKRENSSEDKSNLNDKNKDTSSSILKNNKINKSSLIKEEPKISDEKISYFDESKVNNIQIPKEYINTIYHNLLIEENGDFSPRPIPNYMKNQKEINEQMRSILVDWIIDVHHKFGFADETLFMTILIIDRYSSVEEVTRIKYQCLGITALMIACKHEEINVPKVEDFIYITDNAYTKEEVFKMENDVLSKLNFALLYPSPIKFYEYLSLHFNFDKKSHYLGKYLMESFLLDLKYVRYKPSIISCACAYIVMKFFKMPNYRESYDKKFYLIDENSHAAHSNYGVKECAQNICVYVDNINNTNLFSCQKKYAKNEFECVSTLISNNK